MNNDKLNSWDDGIQREIGTIYIPLHSNLRIGEPNSLFNKFQERRIEYYKKIQVKVGLGGERNKELIKNYATKYN